jgi:methionyl aminopeptidase
MEQITASRIAGDLNKRAIEYGFSLAKPGVTTRQIDHAVGEFIVANGGAVAFKGFRGYPANACIFTDSILVHGIPNDTPIEDGDILTIDCGVTIANWCVDSARTRIIGTPRNESDKSLVNASEKLTFDLATRLRAGISLYEIAAWSEELAVQYGVNISSDFTGHGIGRTLHEPPSIYFRLPESRKMLEQMRQAKLAENSIVCIEPICVKGLTAYDVMPDGWSLRSRTGAMASQTEVCVLILADGQEILC